MQVSSSFQKIYDEFIKIAPIEPGCYVWRGSKSEILYIGKAKNIRTRLVSYYINYPRLDAKIQLMVDQARSIDFYIVDSEIEALILETNLIKKYKPKYNRLMKDDKNYTWMMIDWYKPYPSIKLVREQVDKKAEYYGPYPNRFPVMEVLKRLRKVFPYCEHLPQDLDSHKIQNALARKPCFNYHIGLCSGVCAGIVTKRQHRNNINGIRKFFKGGKGPLIQKFKTNMYIYANTKRYEQAAQLRDRLSHLEYVTQHIGVDKDIDDENLYLFKRNVAEKALDELLRLLKLRKEERIDGYRVECFDISNTQGTNPVASMVVFVGGLPMRAHYRKFKIRSKSTPDDFMMMEEALRRRLLKLTDSKKQRLSKDVKSLKLTKRDPSLSSFPDLIIVDGGKGQLSSAYEVLKNFDLLDRISIVALAKREEEIFQIESKLRVEKNSEYMFSRILLPRKSEALFLAQRIRDEAHRFAIGFHRKLRNDLQTASILDSIEGVGKITKQNLFKTFGSVDEIKKASKSEIRAVVRNAKSAEAIIMAFGIQKT